MNTTARAMMAAFDELPPTVRRVLANSAFHWVPQTILRDIREGVHPTTMVRFVQQSDAQTIKVEAAIVWGEHYPLPRA